MIIQALNALLGGIGVVFTAVFKIIPICFQLKHLNAQILGLALGIPTVFAALLIAAFNLLKKKLH